MPQKAQRRGDNSAKQHVYLGGGSMKQHPQNAASPETPEGTPKPVIITGAAGRVGSKLCQALLDMGRPVVGVDNFFSSQPDVIAPFLPRHNFTFYEGTIAETGLLSALSRHHGPAAAVLHMAAVVSVPWSMAHPEFTMEVNYRNAMVLHEEARGLGIPVFVFAGSAAEYGRISPQPVSEDEAGAPHSPYGLAKYQSSCQIAKSGYGCSLRFFNLYGPANGKPGPYDSVIRIFMDRALAGKSLNIFGDGGHTRDFVHIDDAVRAVLRAAGLIKKATPLLGVYNIGSGRATTILELATLLRKISAKDLPILFLPERPGDVRHSLADVSRLREKFDFVVQTRLEDGMQALFDWHKKQYA